jgi:hypothetical protein
MRVGMRCLFIAALFIAVGLSWNVPQVIPQSPGVPTLTSVVLLNPVPISGKSITLTGMVMSTEPSAGIPSGTMEFFDGPDSLGVATLTNDNGVGMAALTVELPAGFYSIHAVYSGDYAFAFSVSSPSLPLLVIE